ncbi:hypothetical protein E2C01_091583 [Portunus trituberculatus]|uniref:Uncharacterized protein n=1 Tax=Portunus trituberculatus TaxID=210409 RepID=A0A5B7JNB7_PORTR|nr:hypothetical protein [Portunus trituberculatus]
MFFLLQQALCFEATLKIRLVLPRGALEHTLAATGDTFSAKWPSLSRTHNHKLLEDEEEEEEEEEML